MDFHDICEKVYSGQYLNYDEAKFAFDTILTGEINDIVISSFLTALRVRGHQLDEIYGAASALLDVARPFPTPYYDFCDIVGTGGDGFKTINISTISAFVAAALGLKVAKHGNRSISSKTGASDLLVELGINLDQTPERARKSLDENNLCFLFAPYYHSAMKTVMNVRRTLATRTVFNVLGPLINPAHNTFQLLGVYSVDMLQPIAEVCRKLNKKRVMLVNGQGMDEITVTGTTNVCELDNGIIRSYQLNPSDFGLKTYEVKDLVGGEPKENKQITLNILSGKGTDAHNAAIAANTAALLYMDHKAPNLAVGAEMVLDCLKDGRAMKTLEKMVEFAKHDNEENAA